MGNRLGVVVAYLGLLLGGCHSLDRITGTTHHGESPAKFYTVSCCQDNDGQGNVSYPSFLPQSHVDFCQRVKAANHADQTIDGNLYLAMGVDCGHGHHDIGDEFYPSTGY